MKTAKNWRIVQNENTVQQQQNIEQTKPIKLKIIAIKVFSSL